MGSRRALHDDRHEIVVHDLSESCPYLPDRQARMPLRWRSRPLSRSEFDDRMQRGQRRAGPFMYQTECRACQACEAIRLPVADFAPNRSQRRAWRRGEQSLRCEVGQPAVDDRRVDLFNRHRLERRLDRGEGWIDVDSYALMMVDTCCESYELSYWLGGELVGVALADRGERSLSAVYCYYDPQRSELAIGVYSILKQIELCRQWRLDHLYLGFFVAGCRHMEYKAGYRPHERRIGGVWQRFEAAS